jgi:capsular polysaccharide export protein
VKKSVLRPRGGLFSWGIARIPFLDEFVPECKIVSPKLCCRLTSADLILGWGYKATAEKARKFAEKNRIPYWALEDGFVRSLGLGRDGDPPMSLVVDPVGIYYDARSPSQLETLLQDGGWETPELLSRARSVRRWLTSERLSKYNNAPEENLWPDDTKARVLVVDQTFGDMSVVGGLADESTFRDMVQAALDENPEAEVVVKTHPDVLKGYRKGYLGNIDKHPRLQLFTDFVSPWSVLDRVDTVYTVTSLLGFEALLAGKRVRCFGMPFYAGWGLTEDELTCPRRTRSRTLDEVFAATYLKYARYVDPVSGKCCEIEKIITLLSDRRRQLMLTGEMVFYSGASLWKRRFLPEFLGRSRRCVKFTRRPSDSIKQAEKSGGRWALWASTETEVLRNKAENVNVPMIRVEDAFLRSVGLGSDLVRPWSLVLDDVGIYYDASRPSRLETLLRETDFSPFLLDRARKIRESILAHGLTKYNVDCGESCGFVNGDKTAILVVGQVEDDASILRGSAQIQRNIELLQTVHKANPDAYILYKPHPDVIAGNRRGAITESDTLKLCDEVVKNVAMNQLLTGVDEVHTMTSLSGFEALLRGVKVVCYGLPFYAGWGLTKDFLFCERRGRRLSLDQLVAAALILYPSYIDPLTRQVCSVENFLGWLTSNKNQRSGLQWGTRIVRFCQNWRQGT